MARKSRGQSRSSGRFSTTSFVAGIVVGCLTSILVAATAFPLLDNYQPDTAAFPNIDSSADKYEYQFPDLLEASGNRESSEKPVRELIKVADTQESEPSGEQPKEIDSFMLQAGSFEEQRQADMFRATLMLRGYDAKTKMVEIPQIGPRYRVIIGPFASQDEAKAAITRLKTEQVDAVLLGIRDT